MNNKTFQELIENLRQHSSDVLLKKGDEYATEEDRLLNFKQAGIIWQLINPDAIKSKPRSVACFGMMLKHFVSIIDIINSKEPVSIELSYEKFGDIINYFHLLLSNIIDDGGIENTAYTQEKTPEEINAEIRKYYQYGEYIPPEKLEKILAQFEPMQEQQQKHQSYVKSTEDWIQLKTKWKEEQERKKIEADIKANQEKQKKEQAGIDPRLLECDSYWKFCDQVGIDPLGGAK